VGTVCFVSKFYKQLNPTNVRFGSQADI